TVAAASLPPFSFQWQFNGVDILGANGPVLALTNVFAAQAGNYNAIVSNGSGSVTSGTARLSVTLEQRPELSILPSVNEEKFAFGLVGEPGRAFRIESSIDLKSWTRENSFDIGFITAKPMILTSIVRNNPAVTTLELPKTSARKYFRASHYVPLN